MSLDTKGKKGNLLQIASQEIIENSSNNNSYSLLTNTNFYQDISSNELKNILLNTEKSVKKLSFNEILLKLSNLKNQKTNTLNKNILISDFQNAYKNEFTNVNHDLSLIKLQSEQKNNIFIDSIFVNNSSSKNLNINVVVKNQGEAKNNLPIAIYNNEKLISKQTFSIDKDGEKTVLFSVQKSPNFLGHIKTSFSDIFNFDNDAFFSINTENKTNVLAIGNNNNFLSKIYTKNEFNFTSSSVKNVNYNSIEKQQLIVLNEIENLTQTLISSLINFSKNGGSIIVIPNQKSDINSYNSLFKNLAIGNLNPQKKDTLKITDINFSHPLLKNVFDKKVKNFQYPTVQSFYPTSFSNTSNIVSFENKKGFIQQINLPTSKLFWVASSLNKENSNFTNSPLIVPVFYNIGQQSLQLSKLYYTIDKPNKIDISTRLGKDAVLTMYGKNTSFIPLQQTFQNKVTISTKEQPLEAGFYDILKNKDTIQTVAYNYPKDESLLQFLDVDALAKDNSNITISNSVADTLQKNNQKNKIHWLWQWFLALAIVFLLLEIFILKYFKV